MWPGLLTDLSSLQQFFGIQSDLGVASETLTAWAETVRDMYDASIPVEAKPFRVRFVCMDSEITFDQVSPGTDDGDVFWDDGLKKCNFEGEPDPNRGESAAVTENLDNQDPDCLPAIYLCPTFSADGLFFAVGDGTPEDATDYWCGFTPFTNSDTTPLTASDDDNYNDHFAGAYALTLLHEATHIDVLARINGKSDGTNQVQDEVYPRSQVDTTIPMSQMLLTICLSLWQAAQLTFQQAFDNAESYALTWWGKFIPS
jgi:hypothetical protein